ncbi:uroporphyrinogen-III synthase [Sphingomonas sp. SUN039]|uniref:uroporphyrinogen-III synthase n=1 Tax=Sphingomonas sp. SUN039 TaxID=2937787 RepID=UPI00216448A4|nr:uroporphyrinogen-III synthase [Sphingomonas sp. SUN039]UVO55040.1 uroporphyrinogen-III synthase [Sphingomonas sp. SUN039]
MRVLIVRPAPGNEATAEAVAAMGLEPVVVPLFEIVPLAWEAPDPAIFDAVVMTSANAARHGGAGLAHFTHLPLFAVGEATGEAARAVGFGDVRIGLGDAADLADLVVQAEQGTVPLGTVPPQAKRGQSPRGQSLVQILHLTGSDHRSIPTEASMTVVTVYESRVLTPSAPLNADIALVHSPRTGSRLAALTSDRASIRIVAISPAAAAACGSGWAAVHIADIPREHAMLATLALVCEAAASSEQVEHHD